MRALVGCMLVVPVLALQAAALATGFPIALVLLAMCYSVWKGLRAARPT